MIDDPANFCLRLDDLLVHHTQKKLLYSAEVEFYLDPEKKAPRRLLEQLHEWLLDQGFDVGFIEEEEGHNQYEVQFNNLQPGYQLAASITQLKRAIHDFFHVRDTAISMQAKPFEDQPGNGLHIHLSLHDQDNHTPLFYKSQLDTPSESEPLLLYAIGGLLELMEESMPYFAPNESSYLRYQGDKEAPSTISWGGNNRTVAIRIPDLTHKTPHPHLEHRVAGMDANPYHVIGCISLGVLHGLTNRIIPSAPRIYGNAFDPQYQKPPHHLKMLPNTKKKASDYEFTIIQSYLEKI